MSKVVEPDPLDEARKARLHARDGFLDAVDRGSEVRRVVTSLHEHARRNHWGAGLDTVWNLRRN